MSYCNFEIHDEIINEYGHIYFPFCLNGINDYVRNNRGEPCCYEMEMIFYNTHQIFKEFDKILLKMGIKREELTILFSENLF